MKANAANTSRLLSALVVGIALLGGSAPTAWAASDSSAAEHRQDPAERMQARLRARLDKMGERLEIKASQQEAWQAYVKASMALFEKNQKRPEGDADAATVARYRADAAAERAQKLAALSDATAKLQQGLSEPQRKALNQMTRYARHDHHRHHH